MDPKLAVFDIDGTLTDSVAVHQSAFREALYRMGCRNFSTDWHTYPHHTDLGIFRTIYESRFAEPVSAGHISAFEKHLAGGLTKSRILPIRNAPAFLKDIAVSYDVVLATGSLLEPAMMKLEQAGINLPGCLIVASNRHESREAIVSEAIEAAKQFYGRGQYAQILSFGDGLWDLRTAQALGLGFVGIGNPALAGYGAESSFAHFDDPELYRLLSLERIPQ